MITIGDSVRILAPFNDTFDGIYIVVNSLEDGITFTLEFGADFNIEFLEKV